MPAFGCTRFALAGAAALGLVSALFFSFQLQVAPSSHGSLAADLEQPAAAAIRHSIPAAPAAAISSAHVYANFAKRNGRGNVNIDFGESETGGPAAESGRRRTLATGDADIDAYGDVAHHDPDTDPAPPLQPPTLPSDSNLPTAAAADEGRADGPSPAPVPGPTPEPTPLARRRLLHRLRQLLQGTPSGSPRPSGSGTPTGSAKPSGSASPAPSGSGSPAPSGSGSPDPSPSVNATGLPSLAANATRVGKAATGLMAFSLAASAASTALGGGASSLQLSSSTKITFSSGITALNAAQFAYYSSFYGGTGNAYTYMSHELRWTMFFFGLPFDAKKATMPRARNVRKLKPRRHLLSGLDIAGGAYADFAVEKFQESLFYTGIILGSATILQFLAWAVCKLFKKPLPHTFLFPRLQVIILFSAFEGFAIASVGSAYSDAGELGVASAALFTTASMLMLATATLVSTKCLSSRVHSSVKNSREPVVYIDEPEPSFMNRVREAQEKHGSVLAYWHAYRGWLNHETGEWQIGENAGAPALSGDRRAGSASEFRYWKSLSLFFVDYTSRRGLGGLFGVWDVVKKISVAITASCMLTEDSNSIVARAQTAVALSLILIEEVWIVVGRPFRNRYDNLLAFLLNAISFAILVLLRQASVFDDPEDPLATNCVLAALYLTLATSCILALDQLFSWWELAPVVVKRIRGLSMPEQTVVPPTAKHTAFVGVVVDVDHRDTHATDPKAPNIFSARSQQSIVERFSRP